MYQSLTVIGRLGRDPEMKYLASGEAVAEFSIATDRAYNDRNGQKQKETTWFRVSVFGRQAETCNQYLSKGKMVLVEGRLGVDAATGGPRAYLGKDGKPKAAFDVTASTVRFLSASDEGAKADAPTPAAGGSDIPF